jgi:hypothetical protein
MMLFMMMGFIFEALMLVSASTLCCPGVAIASGIASAFLNGCGGCGLIGGGGEDGDMDVDDDETKERTTNLGVSVEVTPLLPNASNMVDLGGGGGLV